MATDLKSILVRRLGQSPLLDPAQRKELAEQIQGNFEQPKPLLVELHRRGWLTLYQIQQLLQGKDGDLLLGSYLVMEKLGEGGNGQVFKARHQHMKRVVALKVVRPDLLSDPDVVQRFYREIEVVSHLSDPHIVHAYDAGPVGSALMLAMEYVDGIDLDHLVQRSGPLAVSQACEYIRQAALGLQHAHERGLVHRDIKPGNLLVTGGVIRPKGAKAPGDSSGVFQASLSQSGSQQFARSQHQLRWGTVKILDLGLARLSHPAPGSKTKNLTVLGGTNVTMGTPDYQAPEQAIDFHTADIRADIYSLGCTLYFLLTGKPVFEGTLPEKLLKHQQVEPKPLAESRDDIPEGLQAIANKALEKLPAHRQQTPGELAEELAELLSTLPADDPAASPETAPDKKRGSTVEISSDQTAVSDPLSQLTEEEKETPAREPSKRPPLGIVIGGAAAGVLALVVLLALVFSGGRTPTPVASAAAPTKPAPPTGPAPQPGLRFAYYEGAWKTLPDFDKLKPIKTGTNGNVNLKPRNRNENFGLVFTGQLVVAKPGKYTFFLSSDDGARLYIKDQMVVDNDGLHGTQEKNGIVDLAAGWQPIRVTYFQGTGGYALDLLWQGPDSPTKGPIPDAALVHQP
jgi:serine/threonine-protein kinase